MKELINERMKDMRKVVIMMIMGVALMALPTMAQDWQSTSAMQGSGSAYSAQVTAVGAAEVTDMASTTTDGSSGPNRRKGKKEDPDPFGGGTITDTPNPNEPGTPIGDAMLPMLLMAMLFAGVVYTRRKRC